MSKRCRTGFDVNQDYSGLHVKENDYAINLGNHEWGKAAKILDNALRLKLNKGEGFSGTLICIRHRHLELYFLRHVELGLVDYDEMVNRTMDSNIEILINNAKDKIRIDRNNFFSRMSDADISMEDVLTLCAGYEKYQIQMAKD